MWRSHSGAHRFHSGWYSRLYTTLASSPQFIRQLGKLKLKRRFWCAPRRRGFWESDVHGSWTEVGRRYPDSEDSQYVVCFRMSKGVFLAVCNLYGHLLHREDTGLRKAVSQEKRMAIVVYWLAHAPSFSTLAALFGIGKSTVVSMSQCKYYAGIWSLHQSDFPQVRS